MNQREYTKAIINETTEIHHHDSIFITGWTTQNVKYGLLNK